MRFVQIDPTTLTPQRVIRLIESDSQPVGEGYIDVTNNPEVNASSWYSVPANDFVVAPEFVPTYQQALSVLNNTYQSDIEKFNKAFALAYLADGPAQETKQSAIRVQYEARKTQHAADIAALKVQFGV